jgi:hypothetical protein
MRAYTAIQNASTVRRVGCLENGAAFEFIDLEDADRLTLAELIDRELVAKRAVLASS